ncbi:MAG: spore cortex biosynthesis protein YabQ [Clostridia bacterium]|nr:spore cortex biosynthesis protein YabQ [Clostridia bacterium]
MNAFVVTVNDAEQARCLWYCLLFGLGLSVGYAPFAWWRITKRRHRWLQATVDIFCCVCGATLLFFFVLAVNGGTLRGAMVLSTALGFLIGHKTIGRALLVLFRVLASLLYALRLRLAVVADLLRKLAKKIAIFFKKGLRYLRTLVYNQN